MVDINDFLENRAKPYLAALAMALTVFFMSLEYFAGPDLSFLILYLIPILMVVWVAGKPMGIFLAVITTAGWFASAVLNKPLHPLPFYTSPFIAGWNVAMEMGVFLLLIYLVSALKTALLHEKELARTDFLTGVANKRHFYEVATLELTRSRRYKRPFAIAYMDIDNFKTVNDLMGHETGDGLLHLVAGTIKQNLRTTDMVARLGGDEFAFFMPETKLEQTRAAVDRLQKILLEVAKNNQWPITFSAGVICYDNAPQTAEEAIKSVDELMYSAKTSGKNKILYEQRSGQTGQK